MLWILLLFFPLSAFGQFTSTARHIGPYASAPAHCSTASGDIYYNTTSKTPFYCSAPDTWTAMGGGGSPAGSLGACNFYLTASTFGGDASVCFENITALTVPSAPIITQGGTPGATSYTYKVALNNAIGPGIFSSGTTTTTGPATLSGVNYNIISAPTCPAGVTTYSVQAANGRGILLALGTCGVAYHDIGGATDFSDHTTTDYSTGIYDGKRLVTADLGDDVRFQTYFGSPESAFSSPIYDISFLDLSYNVIAHAGIFSGNKANALLSLVAEETVSGLRPKALAAEAYSTVSGASPEAVFSLAGASGTANIILSVNYIAEPVVLSSGNNSGPAIGFYMFDGLLNSTGTINEIQGFTCDDLTAGTTRNVCYHSDVAAGVGKWFLYGEGTAASHFGGEVEIVGLKTTGSATGKTVVCVDVATGQLYASTSGVACAN